MKDWRDVILEIFKYVFTASGVYLIYGRYGITLRSLERLDGLPKGII